jgi:hypothetical protein
MPEGSGRFADDDGERPVRLVALRANGNTQPFAPRALSQFFYVLFAAEEFPFTLFGLQ